MLGPRVATTEIRDRLERLLYRRPAVVTSGPSLGHHLHGVLADRLGERVARFATIDDGVALGTRGHEPEGLTVLAVTAQHLLDEQLSTTLASSRSSGSRPRPRRWARPASST
jgi:hypothetical protein